MDFRKYCVYDYGQLAIVIASIILILVKPDAFVKLTKNILGRIVLITLLIMATLHSSLSGILVAIVLVVLTETYYEGNCGKESCHDDTEDNDDSDNDDSDDDDSDDNDSDDNSKDDNKAPLENVIPTGTLFDDVLEDFKEGNTATTSFTEDLNNMFNVN